MSLISHLRVLTAMILFVVAIAPLQAQNSVLPAAPDSTLYTTYSGGPTTLNWIVCGSTAQTSGCYSSGSLGPFIGIGALLEGNPSIKGDVVTRAIYVVDSGDTNSVTLDVYKKTDTVTADFDTVTVTLARTIALPLTGGSTAVVSMAANNGFLFIGTDQSPQAVEVRKSNLSVTQLGGFSPPINVTSITADQYGYVTVTQTGAAFETGFNVYGPNGAGVEGGGGADFMLGTTQAVSAAALLGPDAQPQRRVGYRPKAAN
jgi:hypothetical protein